MTAAILVLAGCGDELMGANYQGEPMFSLEGQVLVSKDLPAVDAEVRVAVFWSSLGEHGSQHEQQASVSTRFPASYTLVLFTPPPDEVLFVPEHAPGSMATGLPMIYEDQDGDGQFDGSSEQVLGGARDVLVVYSSQDVALDEGPPSPDDTGLFPGDTAPPPSDALEAGYHAVVRLGEPCQQGVMELGLVDPSHVDLFIGDLGDFLADLDCDGAHDEWGGL